MKLYLCALLLLLAAVSIQSQDRVVRGQDAEDGFAPYQVSLQNSSRKFFHFCGGSILSDRYILTAAHCLYKRISIKSKELWELQDLTDYVVVTGTNKKSKPGAKYYIDKAFVHCNWTDTFQHGDIALLRLSESIVWNKKTKSIKLPDTEMNPGATVIATGWGQIIHFGESPEKLQKLTQFYIPNDKCQEMMAYGSTNHVDIICGFSKMGEGVCSGDSGGPLVDENREHVVGVANFVEQYCATGTPDAYASTFYYSNWINAVMSENDDSNDSDICEVFEFA